MFLLKLPQVIAGFPGVGKSTLFSEFPEIMSDSDSSKFDKENFPANYIAHIKQLISEGKTVLVSTHKSVRDALIDEEIQFALVYPDVSLKDEYIQRYINRGSPDAFVNLMQTNFEGFQFECKMTPACSHIVLQKDQGLSDLMHYIDWSRNEE